MTTRWMETHLLKDLTERWMAWIFKTPCTLLKKQEVHLIARNSQLHGNDQLCMRVGKEFWGKDIYMRNRRPFPIPANPVHPTLKGEVAELQRQYREILDTEMPYIQGYIRNTLLAFHTVHDLLQLFPDILHAEIKNFATAIDGRNISKNAEPEKLEAYLEYSQKYQSLIRLRLTKNLLIS